MTWGSVVFFTGFSGFKSTLVAVCEDVASDLGKCGVFTGFSGFHYYQQFVIHELSLNRQKSDDKRKSSISVLLYSNRLCHNFKGKIFV